MCGGAAAPHPPALPIVEMIHCIDISGKACGEIQRRKEVNFHVVRPERKRPGPGRVCVDSCFGRCRCNCRFDDPRPDHRQRLQQTEFEPDQVMRGSQIRREGPRSRTGSLFSRPGGNGKMPDGREKDSRSAAVPPACLWPWGLFAGAVCGMGPALTFVQVAARAVLLYNETVAFEKIP